MTLQDKINEMVRDFTTVIPKPKSEVRKRLIDFYKQILEEEIKQMRNMYVITGSQGSSGNDEQDKKNYENALRIEEKNSLLYNLVSLRKEELNKLK